MGRSLHVRDQPAAVDLETAKALTPEEFVAAFRQLESRLSDSELSLSDAEARLGVSESLHEKEAIRNTIWSAENSRLKGELQYKDTVIDWFQRMFFGPRSERRSWDPLDPGQQLLFEEMALTIPDTPPPPKMSVKAHERERRVKPTLVDDHSQLRFDERATVIDIEIPNPDIEGIPEDQLEVVSEKTVYKLAQLSSPFVVVRLIRKLVKKKGTQTLLPMPALPTPVLERSSLDVSFLVGMVISKFLLHLPLYRQHQWLERAGIFLDRGNMTKVVHRLGELLEPIYEELIASVLMSSVLTVDETPTPAGQGKGKFKKGYFWVFYGDQDEVFFLFSPSRGQDVLDETLGVFQGHLLCDGHSAYESYAQRIQSTILCQCWSHSRREFIKAEKLEPERAKWVIDQIRAMYAVEREAEGMSSAEHLALRQSKSKPLVDELFKYIEGVVASATLLPSNPFLKAANYVIHRKTELQVFLSNPEIPLDTNHVERELRPQAVGRKNWLFHVTEVGARYAGIFYSLIRSCIVAGVDPTVYLTDVLQRIAILPAMKKNLLIPRLWKEHFSEEPLGSVADGLLLRAPP